jgi:hypothetical protein
MARPSRRCSQRRFNRSLTRASWTSGPCPVQSTPCRIDGTTAAASQIWLVSIRGSLSSTSTSSWLSWTSAPLLLPQALASCSHHHKRGVQAYLVVASATLLWPVPCAWRAQQMSCLYTCVRLRLISNQGSWRLLCLQWCGSGRSRPEGRPAVVQRQCWAQSAVGDFWQQWACGASIAWRPTGTLQDLHRPVELSNEVRGEYVPCHASHDGGEHRSRLHIQVRNVTTTLVCRLSCAAQLPRYDSREMRGT